MNWNDSLSPEEKQQLLADFKKRFDQAMKYRPHISDQEFMAETEVSDEQYAIGLVLPGIGDAND